jgi:hypothetical protein
MAASKRQGEKAMQKSRVALGLIASTVLFVAGCHSKAIDKQDFRSALDSYYASQQTCLWSTPEKFPEQADTDDDAKTRHFDALTDAGLLKRIPAEKKRFLIGSKNVNNYDLSDQGRSNWTADAAEPGYGNFCFGHPKVTSIDSFTPDTGDATQYSVNYHYGASLPSWANNAEIQTAFPSVAALSQGRSASAMLNKTENGWQVQNISPATDAPQSQ